MPQPVDPVPVVVLSLPVSVPPPVDVSPLVVLSLAAPLDVESSSAAVELVEPSSVPSLVVGGSASSGGGSVP